MSRPAILSEIDFHLLRVGFYSLSHSHPHLESAHRDAADFWISQLRSTGSLTGR